MSDACCDACAPGEGGPDQRIDQASVSIWQVRAIRAAGLAGLFLGAGLVAARGSSDAASALYAVALVVSAATFVPGTVRNLLQRQVGVGTLMTIAAVGAVILGEIGEAATLAFLFSISEGLEAYALTRARQGLRALLSLVPAEATTLRNGQQVVVPADQLLPGMTLLVRPGERVATDGVVKIGNSALDNSAITGESMPVEVGSASEVFAAAINGNGVLQVEVTARTEENSLARIVRIVEDAQDRKSASQRIAQRIAKPLVPGVMLLAAAIAGIGSAVGSPELWLHRALVVLVAAAPCAFAISVPVTVVAAIGAATRSGVLIKGGAALEALARIQIVALDKTGTLTRNEPQVAAVVPADDVNEHELLDVAAALEASSEHPLAVAILTHHAAETSADAVEAIPGSGLVGLVDGVPARLGRPGYIAAGRLTEQVAEMQEEGATVVLVERNAKLLGAIAVRDQLREEAPEVVRTLRRPPLNIREVVMLTGDNSRTAAAVGRLAAVDEVGAELLPQDKVKAVEQLQQRGSVAMVGDGVNDAPALATADVGIAMAAMGSDVAIETADVALMGEDLRHLPHVLVHARRSMHVMKQNLLLSGMILVVLIPLAAAGMLGLAAVVAAHELAEVLVIANGIRAGRLQRLDQQHPGARRGLPKPTGSTEGEAPGSDRIRTQVPLVSSLPRD